MVTNKRQFTLRLSDENFEKIKRIADINKRSIAMQIEYLIEKYIEKWENENGKIDITEDR
jgi:hypothetical protein